MRVGHCPSPSARRRPRWLSIEIVTSPFHCALETEPKRKHFGIIVGRTLAIKLEPLAGIRLAWIHGWSDAAYASDGSIGVAPQRLLVAHGRQVRALHRGFEFQLIQRKPFRQSSVAYVLRHLKQQQGALHYSALITHDIPPLEHYSRRLLCQHHH